MKNLMHVGNEYNFDLVSMLWSSIPNYYITFFYKTTLDIALWNMKNPIDDDVKEYKRSYD